MDEWWVSGALRTSTKIHLVLVPMDSTIVVSPPGVVKLSLLISVYDAKNVDVIPDDGANVGNGEGLELIFGTNIMGGNKGLDQVFGANVGVTKAGICFVPKWVVMKVWISLSVPWWVMLVAAQV